MRKWEWIADDSLMCAECGRVFDTNDNADAVLWDFCPNCGASMTEEAEEPCRFKDTCIGACEWCKSHDYSEACVPMLQAEIERIKTQEKEK
jgi:predicted  nucleic acid-binding Zn-ribbon protein